MASSTTASANTLNDLLWHHPRGISLALIFPPTLEEQTFIHSWCNFFWENYQNFLAEKKVLLSPKVALNHHPDVLYFAAGESIEPDAISKIQQFEYHQSYLLPQKLVIISGPQKISITSANKLLKFIETPNIPVHVLFVGLRWNEMLPTLKSRLMGWRLHHHEWSQILASLPASDTSDSSNPILPAHLATYLKQKNGLSSEFWQLCVTHEVSEQQLHHYVLNQVLKNKKNFQQLDQWIKLQQWMETSLLFHNSIQERIHFIYQFLKSLLGSNAL